MKILAFFLPQFHETEENNKWWGKGFTEWEHLKKAKSLYLNHEQPRIPLNKNYYDLNEKEIMIWQTNLLNNYKIYGLCYYHYWSVGNKLLNKPVENLLVWKELKQNYCLYWGNHSWTRSWVGDKKTILFKQEYGEEKEWELHFEYLKKFFKDERYIKVEGRPLFIIFLPIPSDIRKKMFDFFEARCKKEGFKGIYIVETINSIRKSKDVINNGNFLLREPDCSLAQNNYLEKIIHHLSTRYKRNYLFLVKRYKYDNLVRKSLETSNYYCRKNTFPCVFTGWDNTPRYKKRGFVIEGNTPEKFKKYLLKQKEIMKKNNCEYIFLNAWNEWTEGMYLEPDEKNGYKYLEMIKEVVETEV